jgi:hypothetical protein
LYIFSDLSLEDRPDQTSESHSFSHMHYHLI